ncbi:DNA primase, partial [Salmonella enterica subsp. enterica serovar Agona]|nr:DNA primase [Salmonella enterica subsp. enterica serovar Agona]
FPYFPYLSGIMKIKTALYSLFSRLDWHKTVVFPCLGEIYEGIRSLSWEIPVT